MDLHDHTAFKTRFQNVFGYGDHGTLHDVGSGSLHRHVRRLSFGAFANVLIRVVQSFDKPLATENGFDVSGRSRFFKHGIVIRTDSRIAAEKRLDVSGGFRWARADRFGKSETGNSVDDSEIYGLRNSSLVFGNRSGFRKKELGSLSMDVAAIFERREECRIP